MMITYFEYWDQEVIGEKIRDNYKILTEISAKAIRPDQIDLKKGIINENSRAISLLQLKWNHQSII